MKRIFILLIFSSVLMSACTRLVSTPAPEPSLTGGIRSCTAADLQTSSSSNGASGAIVLGVTLLNQSKSPCALVGPPEVTLTDGSRPLDVEILPAEDQTQPAPAGLTIAPGESAVAILLWRNYCAQAPKNGATIHLVLPSGESLEIKTDIMAIPRCDVKDQPSTLTVNPYSYPP